jgi:hypothetical protein
MIDNLTCDWAATRRVRDIAVITVAAAVQVTMRRRVILLCALRLFTFFFP